MVEITQTGDPSYGYHYYSLHSRTKVLGTSMFVVTIQAFIIFNFIYVDHLRIASGDPSTFKMTQRIYK